LKIIKFLTREFIATTRIKTNFCKYWSYRIFVINYLQIYLIVSSFLLRVIVRLFLKNFKRGFIPIKVRYKNNLVINFPLFAYLNHSEDLFHLYYDYYFMDYSKFFKRQFEFKDGDTVVDIGAHIGTFSIPLAAKFPIVVYAFEPDMINANYLNKNVKANSLNSTFFVIQKAISSTTGESEFVVGDASTRGTLIDSNLSRMIPTNSKYFVKTITFDYFLKQYNIQKIKLLKIDCEGAEYNIIKNFNSEIFKLIENIFIEIHPVNNLDNKPHDLINLILDNGFIGYGNELDNGCYEYYFSKNINQ
jgi:FkbM family methyltransferase